ncbi:MAG: DUF3806 domain-containing protein [Halieaceae bacterium]|jgi:hypothetical protein|nr:DUF3806 domain-containing protein [Halieaceae bacterium]
MAVALCTAVLGAGAGYAEDEARISQLTRIDSDYLQRQRDAVDSLARLQLGRQIHGERGNDIDVLQGLLDRQAVAADDRATLQGMGIVLGDLLAKELDMHWVIYEDKLGRSRALRYGDSDLFLYPVTMISRRVEAGAEADVQAIFDKAVSLMRPHLPTRPFQY